MASYVLLRPRQAHTYFYLFWKLLLCYLYVVLCRFALWSVFFKESFIRVSGPMNPSNRFCASDSAVQRSGEDKQP